MSELVEGPPSEELSTRSLLRDRVFVVALIIAVVIAIGFGLVVPIVPEFARSFGVSLFAASAVVSVFVGVRLVSNLFTGVLTDRIGTRNAIGFGVLAVAGSSAAVAAAPNYPLLLLFRGVGGFGSALFFNALLTLVVTSVPGRLRGRAVGTLQGAFLIGIALGPSVGGTLAEPLGLRWPFLIYAGFLSVAGAVAFTLLPGHTAPAAPGEAEQAAAGERAAIAETEAPQAVHSLARAWQDLRGFARIPEFAAALIMMGASRWVQTGIRFALVPLFAADVLGASSAEIGFALTLAAVTHLIVVWPAGRFSDRVGRRALAWPAHLAYAAACLGLAFVTSVPAFLVVSALYGIGTGLTGVVAPAVVGDVVAPERAGVAIGALNTAGDFGSVLGPLVCGWLADGPGYTWAFAVSAALLVAGAVAGFRMRETLPAT